MKSVTTVLFVENDAVALTMYQKRLQREGFHVETAEDGIAALRVLSEITPDIVILDLMLPKFSGKDVFDYMRADNQFKQVPIIIFSNAPRTEWPQNPEASPTRGLPKSEANFASLLELIKEMTAAQPEPVAAPVLAGAPAGLSGAQPEPAVVFQMQTSTATAVEEPPVSADMNSVETVEQFLEYATADMTVIRESCLGFIKAPVTDAGKANLSTLRQRLQALDVGAQKSKCARLSLLAGAWEAMLAEIERKPSITSPSVLQTLAQAADCLRILVSQDSVRALEPVPRARVLSVDDDEICNHVAVSALERANMNADSVLDAKAALDLLNANNYDMVLLDINMPGLTGFELCEKLRALPQHQKTPVIFVTAFNNFENRKQSVLSGGGDLIAKPVSPLELALKVTIHLLKAPPKTATMQTANATAEPALVWKEPVETISHDSEFFLKSPQNGDSQANLVVPKTETRSSEPEPVKAEPKAPAPEPPPISPTISGDSLQRALSQPPTPPAEPVKKAEEPKPVVQNIPTPPPVPENVAKPEPVLENTQKPITLPKENTTVPSQPTRSNQPAAPAPAGASKPSQTMNKENNQQFETLVLDVAHIIFGDNAPDINIRLVRMALEQVWQNRANLQSIDSIAREIARIIFGDASASDLNVRLVRMALERSNSIALFKAA